MSLKVYNASAGSGKTFSLAAQYIAQLLKSAEKDDFQHILAVTFTVKATGEMKDRILGTLSNIADINRKNLQLEDLLVKPYDETGKYILKIAKILKNKENTDNLKQATETWLKWSEIKDYSASAFEILKAILHHYDRFKVTTIDSFFQTVLRGVAHELGLPAGLRTEIGNDEVRRMAVQRLMDSISSDNEAQKLVKQFVNDRLDADQRWNVSSLLETFSEWLFKEEYMQYRDDIETRLESNPNLMADFRKDLSTIRKNAEEKMDSLAVEYQKQSASWDSENLFSCWDGRKLKTIKGFGPKLASKAAIDISKTKALIEFFDDCNSVLKKGTPTAAQETALQEVHRLFVSSWVTYQDSYKKYIDADSALSNLHQLGLLQKIGRLVTEINSEKEQFLLAHTGALLNDLMSHGGNSVFVFDKIGPRLNSIMIDEFQDTSRQQWDNFSPLIQELIDSGKDNLIVGDIKQSLYRWRNGDWRVLNELNNDKSGMVLKEPLKENYRSQDTIIHFNNRLFPSFARLLDGPEVVHPSISSIYAEVEQLSPEKDEEEDEGLVRLRFYSNKEARDDDQYTDLQNQILELNSKGIPFGKMAILVRYKKNTPSIIKAFAERSETAHIKLVSGDAFMLQSSWAVQVIINILRCLYAGSVTPEGEEQYRNILSETFLDCLSSTVTFDWKEFQKCFDMPLLEVNERLVAQLDLTDHSDQVPFVTSYIDQVSQYVQNNPADLGAFLDYWDDVLYQKTISAVGDDALQIITIHSSKGLAFDHVFVPNCDFATHKFHRNDVHWVSTDLLPEEFRKLPVLPINFYASTRLKHSSFANEILLEERQQHLDNINLIYVAFTRAKKSLYVWGATTIRSSTSVAQLLLDAVNQMPEDSYVKVSDEHTTTFLFEAKNKKVSKKNNAVTTEKRGKSRLEPIFHPLECSLSKPQHQPQFRQSISSLQLIGDGDTVQLGAILVEGTQIHDILSLVHTADQLDEAILQYRSSMPLDDKTEDTLRALFAQGLKRPIVADWFSGKYKVFNEQTLITPVQSEGLETHTPRPDRVLVNEREVKVIDFKFSRFRNLNPDQHEKYLKQVQAYMHILAQIYPSHTLSGYIWYLKDNYVEEVD